MALTDNIVWASEADAADVLSPSAEKQKKGWIKEIPPHEWFNWYFNRTDTRLIHMEEPARATLMSSMGGSRKAVLRAGTKLALSSPYIVGAKSLRVWVEGLLCEEGEDNQYVEVGRDGEPSSSIRFTFDLPVEYDVKVEIPIRATENAQLFDSTVSLEQLSETIISILAGSTLHGKLTGERDVSPSGSREGVIVAGDEYVVPDYLVGKGTLEIFVDGVLQTPGEDYDEVGAFGETATTIVWKKRVGREAVIIAHSSTSTSNVDVYTAGMDELIARKVRDVLDGVDIAKLKDIIEKGCTCEGGGTPVDPTPPPVTKHALTVNNSELGLIVEAMRDVLETGGAGTASSTLRDLIARAEAIIASGGLTSIEDVNEIIQGLSSILATGGAGVDRDAVMDIIARLEKLLNAAAGNIPATGTGDGALADDISSLEDVIAGDIPSDLKTKLQQALDELRRLEEAGGSISSSDLNRIINILLEVIDANDPSIDNDILSVIVGDLTELVAEGSKTANLAYYDYDFDGSPDGVVLFSTGSGSDKNTYFQE